MSEVPFTGLQQKLAKTPLDASPMLSQANWDEQRAFLALAKFKTYAATEANTGMSHSTIKRCVQRLEDLLQVSLVESKANTLRLTQQGQILARHLQEIDAKMKQLQEMITRRATITDTVTICVTDGLAAFWLAPNIQDILGDATALNIRFVTPTHMLAFDQNPGQIFIGLTPQTRAGLTCEPLGHIHFMPMTTKQYVTQHGMPSLQNLEEHAFVQSHFFDSDLPLWQPWNDCVRRARLVHYSDSSIVHAQLVKANYGIGLLGTYTMLDPDCTPIANLNINVKSQLYITAETQGLQANHVNEMYQAIKRIFGPENPWFRPDPILDPPPSKFDSGFKRICNLK